MPLQSHLTGLGKPQSLAWGGWVGSHQGGVAAYPSPIKDIPIEDDGLGLKFG